MNTIINKPSSQAGLSPWEEKDRRPPTSIHKVDEKLYVATLNVLTLKSEKSLLELTTALNHIKWDILGLSEVRRMGDNIEEHCEFIFYYKGETPGRHGIGFLIKKYLKNYIDEIIGISERIAILNVKFPKYKDKWAIIQIYSHTEQASKDDINKFYSDLNRVASHSHKNLIVMGDFNAQIGSSQKSEDIILGP